MAAAAKVSEIGGRGLNSDGKEGGGGGGPHLFVSWGSGCHREGRDEERGDEGPHQWRGDGPLRPRPWQPRQQPSGELEKSTTSRWQPQRGCDHRRRSNSNLLL